MRQLPALDDMHVEREVLQASRGFEPESPPPMTAALFLPDA